MSLLFLYLTTSKAQGIEAFPGFWSVGNYEDDTQITR